MRPALVRGSIEAALLLLSHAVDGRAVPMGIGSIPTVKRSPDGILALVLCIFLGGLGTIIVGAIHKGPAQKDIIITGVIQLVLSIILVGYIWALIWGIMTFVKSTDSGA